MSTSDKPQHETGTYNHNGDRNPASREDLPVEWWVRKYGLSEVEVRACRKAAAQMGRYRRWHLEVRKRSRGSGETWDAASPDDVLLASLPEAPSVLRQSQLAQVVFEIAVDMGVRTDRAQPPTCAASVRLQTRSRRQGSSRTMRAGTGPGTTPSPTGRQHERRNGGHVQQLRQLQRVGLRVPVPRRDDNRAPVPVPPLHPPPLSPPR